MENQTQNIPSTIQIIQPSSRAGLTIVSGSSGCNADGKTRGSCGSSAGPADLSAEVWEKIKNHPCYSEEAHHYYARMHVAVAPACNIQCNYCNRKYDCSNESRPGVVSERLTPEQGAKKALAVAAAIPQMTVLGIAGPGDPLANPEKTFKTFSLVAQSAPDIKLCLSTNGLMLPDYIDEIQKLNIDHVTITINMIDPEIGAKIYPWVYYAGKKYTGVEASRLLSERQLLGLEMLRERGILCKVNSVMIPGINDQHLPEVNREVKKRGAFLHNIMPLISAPEHGTVFGLSGQRGPTAQELKQLQDVCEGDMKMMRHCRQCRADAVGMLGEDRSSEFSLDKLEQMPIASDPAARQKYQSAVEGQRKMQEEEKRAELLSVAGMHSSLKLQIAVASKGSGRINQHFGHAREFQIYEVGVDGAKFVGHRRVDQYCQGGYGEEESLETVVRAIRDCVAVFVAKIGSCPRKELEAAGIEPVDRFAQQSIEASAIAYFREYLKEINTGNRVHMAGSDAEIRQGALTA